MKNGTKILIGIGVVILLVAVYFGSTYNSFVKKEEDIKNALANIDVQLERRADLIPNLVNAVKGYMKHEEKVIENITKARENLVGAKSIEEKSDANDELTKALNNLFVIIENYPDLKANTNFINLQDELAGSENRISTARQAYNESVKEYNSQIKTFPSMIVAKMFNFKEKEFFEASESSTKKPEVNFED